MSENKNANIPAEVIEAAARANFEHINHSTPWDAADIEWQDAYRLSAVAALVAALPHLLSAKVAEVKENNDHITEGGDGYSSGFHYALHCIGELNLPEAVRSAKERAWDEGALAGWQQSGEGWNAEYPDESTGGCSVDLNKNPYKL